MSKQCLDVQQMQHLQELGLDTSDASMCWIKDTEGNRHLSVHDEYCYEASFMDPIPAYTLQDVLDALPASIKHKDFIYYLVYNKSEGFIGYYGVDFDGNNRYARYEEFYNGIDGLSVIDAAYEILVWCIENKFVETNKNE